MATDVKFSICQSSNCKTINFTETTGEYNDPDNLTGWGGVNEDIGDATSATLTLTGPNGTVYEPVDLFALDNFPKKTSESYGIDASTVSSTLTDFEDGQWEMTYAVTTGTTTYTETITFFFHCKVSACVCKKIANIDLCDCNCDPETLRAALEAKALSDALSYAVGCGNLTGANEILATLKKSCGC